MAALAYVIVLLAMLGLAGWGALTLLVQRSLARTGFGLLLLLACIVLPFFLSYGWFYGSLAAAIGAVVAAVQLFGRVGWVARVGFVVAIAFVLIEPAASVFYDDRQTAERFGRCEGDVAIRTIRADLARDGHYPPDIHTVAVDSAPYESPSCPIYQNVNWLYHAGQTDYTLGYWVDWRVGKHVCLHSSGQKGWSCGLNRWGPFSPA
jgi:hypothetical protein